MSSLRNRINSSNFNIVTPVRRSTTGSSSLRRRRQVSANTRVHQILVYNQDTLNNIAQNKLEYKDVEIPKVSESHIRSLSAKESHLLKRPFKHFVISVDENVDSNLRLKTHKQVFYFINY